MVPIVSTLDTTVFLEELMTAGKELADTEAEVKRLQILREKLQNRITAHEQYLEVLKANPIDDETSG